MSTITGRTIVQGTRHGYRRRYNPIGRSLMRARRRIARRSSRRYSSRAMVLSRNPRDPIPPRAIVKFHQTVTGYFTSGFTAGNIYYPMNLCYRPMASATLTNCAIQAPSATTDSPNCWLNYVGTATGLYLVHRVLSHGLKIHRAGQAQVNGGVIIACAPTTTGAPYGTFQSCSQARFSRMGPWGNNACFAGTDIKWSKSLAALFGVSPAAYMGGLGYASLTPGTLPTEPCYMNIYFRSENNAATTANSCFVLELFWTVQLEQPNYVNSTD